MHTNIIISKNIKTLRKLTGESQQDLANSLKLSRSTIANYETGINLPDINTISAISYHYGCTIDTFVNTDLSSNVLPKNTTLHLINRIKEIDLYSLFTSIFPFVDDYDDADSQFKKAVHKHKQILVNPAYCTDYFEIVNLYADSYNKHKKIDALINIINLTFLYITTKKYTPSNEYNEVLYKLMTGTLDANYFIKNYLLKNYIFKNDLIELTEQDKEDLDTLYENLENFIHALKHSNFEHKVDYIQYLNTIMYIFNLHNNSNSEAINHKIGIELLNQQINAKNSINNNIFFEILIQKLNF